MNILPAVKCAIAASCLMLVLVMPAVAEDQAKCPNPAENPIMRTHTLVPYPDSSARRHEQGTATFLVSLGADGVPTDVALVRSRASQRLDDAAIEYIKTNWRWQPFLPDCPSTAQVAVRIIWNLMYSGIPRDADFHIKMPTSAYPTGVLANVIGGQTFLLIKTNAQGEVTRGRVFESSGFSDLDDQALAIVKNSPALMKGQEAGEHLISADWGTETDNSPALPALIETEIRTARVPP